jgi:hypothetical protein
VKASAAVETLGSRRGWEPEGLAGRTSNRVEGGAWVLAGRGSSLFERPHDQVESYPPGCIWWQRREPRREARRHRHCLELPPVSSVTGDQELELQSRCPSGVSNRRKRTNRACTGDATKKRRCFGHERGAPRGARDGFVTWIPTETDRPARPTMGNHRGTADDALSGRHLGVQTGVDAAGAFSPLLIPWERQARIDSSAPRKHGGDPEGSRCWPRRSLLTHRKALASDGPGGGRATGDAIGARSVGHRGESSGTRSWGTMEDAFLVRDGRGLSQRTAPVRGPRIHERASKAGSADGL